MQPKGKVVSLREFYNWRHEQHNQKRCYCGQFACIGFQYRLGMIELLCFKHYKERINNGTNQETKEITNGFTKSNFEKTKEK